MVTASFILLLVFGAWHRSMACVCTSGAIGSMHTRGVASRARLGGLSSFESVLHGVLITLASASLALMLGSRPAGAWSLEAAPTLARATDPSPIESLGCSCPAFS